jgi:hypothetical protein
MAGMRIVLLGPSSAIFILEIAIFIDNRPAKTKNESSKLETGHKSVESILKIENRPTLLPTGWLENINPGLVFGYFIFYPNISIFENKGFPWRGS